MANIWPTTQPINANNKLTGTIFDDFILGEPPGPALYDPPAIPPGNWGVAGGNDTFVASKGNDIIDGGDRLVTAASSKDDCVDYSKWGQKIYVNLTLTTVLAPPYIDPFGVQVPLVGSVYKGTIAGVGYFDTFVAEGYSGLAATRSSIEGIIGTAFADEMLGDAKANKFVGNAGNDKILSDGGNDTVDGGAGNDTIDAGTGNDTVKGGGNNDSIIGGLGNDTIDAGTGNDKVYADFETASIFGGNDSVVAGTGNDTVWGGFANDTILGDDGNDFLWGDNGNITQPGGGDDQIYGGAGNDTLKGEEGNDTLDGGLGSDLVYGHAGNDVLREGNGAVFDASFDFGNDTIFGGDGNDTIGGLFGNDDLYGESGDDSMIGEVGNDFMDGGDGDDCMDGDGFFALLFPPRNDTMCGGDGNDCINGQGGDDDIYGQELDDSIDGGDGDDAIFGGTGDDDIRLGNGADYVNAGGGEDEIFCGNDDAQDYLYFGCLSFQPTLHDIIYDLERCDKDCNAYDVVDVSGIAVALGLVPAWGPGPDKFYPLPCVTPDSCLDVRNEECGGRDGQPPIYTGADSSANLACLFDTLVEGAYLPTFPVGMVLTNYVDADFDSFFDDSLLEAFAPNGDVYEIRFLNTPEVTWLNPDDPVNPFLLVA